MVKDKESVSLRPGCLVVAISIGAAAGAGASAYVGFNYFVDILLALFGGAVALQVARWLPKATWSDMVGGSLAPLDTPAQRRANIIGLLGFALVFGVLIWLSFK